MILSAVVLLRLHEDAIAKETKEEAEALPM
jgi:hypothetical protein